MVAIMLGTIVFDAADIMTLIQSLRAEKDLVFFQSQES